MNEKYRMLSTGRGAQLRQIVQSATNDPRGLPTRSELKAALAEVYPGDANAKLREDLFEKAIKIAEARAAGADVMELRGLADELVVLVETKLADDDRIIPAGGQEEADANAIEAAVAGSMKARALGW